MKEKVKIALSLYAHTFRVGNITFTTETDGFRCHETGELLPDPVCWNQTTVLRNGKTVLFERSSTKEYNSTGIIGYVSVV